MLRDAAAGCAALLLPLSLASCKEDNSSVGTHVSGNQKFSDLGEKNMSAKCRIEIHKPSVRLVSSKITSAVSGKIMSPEKCLTEGFTPFSEKFEINGEWSVTSQSAMLSERKGKWWVDNDQLYVKISADDYSSVEKIVFRDVFYKKDQFYIEHINYHIYLNEPKGILPPRYIPVALTS